MKCDGNSALGRILYLIVNEQDGALVSQPLVVVHGGLGALMEEPRQRKASFFKVYK